MPEATGRGFATEATTALLAVADAHDNGELLCIVAVDNLLSRRVAEKVVFRWWQRFNWPDDLTNPTDLLIRPVGTGGTPVSRP